jgi:hypothetical protein
MSMDISSHSVALDSQIYRLFGNLRLSQTEGHLHEHAMKRSLQLEPHLQELESRPGQGRCHQSRKDALAKQKKEPTHETYIFLTSLKVFVNSRT